MTSIDQRDRIARALSEADVSGPDDFDQAEDTERDMYDRMALAALDHAHVYAIHTHRGILSSSVLSSISTPFTLTMAGDSYREWAEEPKGDEPLHVVIGMDDPDAVRDLALSLSLMAAPFDVTRHSDWADEEPYGGSASTEEGLGLSPHRGWDHWMKETNGYAHW